MFKQDIPQQLEWFQGCQLPTPLEQSMIEVSPLGPVRRVDRPELVPGLRARWYQLEEVTQGLTC